MEAWVCPDREEFEKYWCGDSRPRLSLERGSTFSLDHGKSRFTAKLHPRNFTLAGFSPSPLEILHRSLMFLSGFAGRKRSQILTLSSLGILLARIQTILPGL
jgi:hypothetical protein